MRIIGITDEQTTCDLCGRVELKSTVIIGDDDRVEVGRYGSTCAGKMLTEATGKRVTGVLALARTIEAVRRQNACQYLREAVKHAKAGEWGRANYSRFEGKRWYTYIRPDEIALNDKILRLVKAASRDGETAVKWED